MENKERRPFTPITLLTGERGGLRINFLAAIAFGGFGFYLTRALFAYNAAAFIGGALGVLWGSKAQAFRS